jgi:Zn-dependent M16 (insulinase) family peptidase
MKSSLTTFLNAMTFPDKTCSAFPDPLHRLAPR